jgi:hypothetical protein
VLRALRNRPTLIPRSLAAVCPLVVAAAALWLSAGAVSPISSGPSTRVAAVPAIGVVFPLLIAAAVLGWVLGPRRSRVLRPLYLTLLLFLPWLPVPIPAAFLSWDGPLAWAVWIVAIALMARPVVRAVWSRVLATPSHSQLALSIAIAVLVYAIAAWRMAPVLPGGDEPHYLVITQSLLRDGDLQIENNHRRGDYRAYIDYDLKPDYLRRGHTGQIYSIHAPGLSALVLPAFALGGYRGVVVFLAIVSGFGAGLVWQASWRITGNAAAAWAGWAAVALSAPFLMQAFTVYPDGAAAVLVMTGVYGLAFPARLLSSRGTALAHGAALAMLPWLHTRYAILAGALGLFVTARLLARSADDTPVSFADRAVATGAFLTGPALSALAWFWFFFSIYGTLNPAAPYGGYTQTALSNVPRGLAGLLVDQQFGLLPNAPAYLIATVGLGTLWCSHRRLATEMMVLATSYAATVALYHMWWAGHSSPARFLVPVLLPLGIAVAARWARSTAPARASQGVLLAISVAIAGVLVWVDRGALAYNVRDGFCLWLDRAAPIVSLPRAAPSLFRNSPTVVGFLALTWAAAAVIPWIAIRRLPVLGDTDYSLRAWFACAVTVMIGATLGWSVTGAAPLESGTALLRVARAAARGEEVLSLSGFDVAHPTGGAAGLEVPSGLRRDAAQNDPLFVGRGVPAGHYRVVAAGGSVLAGALDVTVGRRVGPLVHISLDGVGAAANSTALYLPAGAQVLTVTADALAARTVERVTLQIQSLERGPQRFATSVSRYGDTQVWFTDDRAFPEPEGWWVPGRGSAAVLLEPLSTRAAIPLRVRNGAAANRVTLLSREWRAVLDLEPGEDRPIHVPISGRRAPLEVASAGGFRPSDVDPSSKDTRLLGVFLAVVGRD